MEMKNNFIIIFILSLIFPIIKQYDVDLYGIPMADVIIQEDTINFNNQKAIKLTYETKTNKFTSNLFKIDNIYETIIDEKSFRILSFKKSTFQPNVTNNVYTTLIQDTIKYYDTNIIVPKNTFNIFSLLYYLCNTDFELIENNVLVEREGLIYNCNIVKAYKDTDIEINLELNLINNKNKPVFEHTDIFTWALFKAGSSNKVLINNDKIVSCNFKHGFTNLKSSLK